MRLFFKLNDSDPVSVVPFIVFVDKVWMDVSVLMSVVKVSIRKDRSVFFVLIEAVLSAFFSNWIIKEYKSLN